MFRSRSVTPSLSADQDTNEMSKDNRPPREVTSFDIWALGITIVIGGQYFAWNFGLSAGFGSYAIAIILISLAYICLIFCISEITSGLPFAGGSYGLARITLGFYPGFIVGCSEAIEYIIYTATSCIALGRMISDLLNLDVRYNPLIWIAFYVSAVGIQVCGGRVFWDINMILAIASVVIILVYIFGSLAYVNFDRHANRVNVDDTSNEIGFFLGGGMEFMAVFRLATWFYVGVEALAFAANQVSDPKKMIPTGSMSCVLTLFVTCIMVYFVASSLPAGENSVTSSAAPLSQGFSLMFGISEQAALILSIPATYATAFGFIYPYGKLLESLANSKLIPSPFQWTHASTKTPYFSIVAGSVVGYLICIVVYFAPVVGTYLFDICILSGMVTYVSQCIGYLAMSTKFQSISREFHSPFGKAGAIFAMLVFMLGILSVIAFQSDQVALVTYIVLVLVSTIYYYAYVKNVQTLSEDESKTLFIAHVIRFNKNSSCPRTSREAVVSYKVHSSQPSSRRVIPSRSIFVGTGSNVSRQSFVEGNIKWADFRQKLKLEIELESGESPTHNLSNTNIPDNAILRSGITNATIHGRELMRIDEDF